MAQNIVSTPTHERCVTSYAVGRTQYKPGVVHPPHIKVKDAIDIHCHTHEGQQDPLRSRAPRLAGGNERACFSRAYRVTIRLKRRKTSRTMSIAGRKKEGVTPITCWSSYVCGRQMAPISAKTVSEMIDRGIAAVWLPALHPCNYHEPRWAPTDISSKAANTPGWTDQFLGNEAMQVGHYDLDENA